jgi:hypothetical protein
MKLYPSVFLFSLAMVLAPFQLSFASSHAHPATHHVEENDPHQDNGVLHTVATTGTHSVTQAHSDHANDKHVDNTKEKADANKEKDKQPLQPSIADIHKSINKIFAKEGNPKFLDKKEIYHLSKDRDISGQESATLAAMVLAISNAKNPEKVHFTEAKLLDKLSKPSSDLYYYYTLALSNINGIRTLPEKERLLGPGGITYKTQIIQNSDGDCYFLSALNSLMQTTSGPKDLEKMITPIEGKTDEFKVKFPGDPTPEIVKLTDTEVGMYSHLAAGGKWLAILSVAEAMRRDRLHLDPEITMNGGYQTQTFSLLTGKKYILYNIPTSNLDKKQAKWMADTITSALNDNLPIGIETSDHDLSIIGYESGNVIIKNPWGTSGWYNPTTGGSSSSTTKPTSSGPWYLMENGVFSVAIGNIPSGFTQIAYYTGAKADVSANFTPKLPVPSSLNIPPINFKPSVQVAPVQYEAENPVSTLKDHSNAQTEINDEKKPLNHCHYNGNDSVGCSGN